MIKTQEGLLYTNITSLFIERIRKGCVGFYCARELEIEHNCNILTAKFMAVTLCLSRSLDTQPEALGSTLLGAGFLYCILSAYSLDLNSSGPKWPFRPNVAFITTSSLQLAATPTQLKWSSNSTKLYNRSTPTRSLKLNL